MSAFNGRYGEFDPTPRQALVNLHRWRAQQSPRLRYTRILSTRPSIRSLQISRGAEKINHAHFTHKLLY